MEWGGSIWNLFDFLDRLPLDEDTATHLHGHVDSAAKAEAALGPTPHVTNQAEDHGKGYRIFAAFPLEDVQEYYAVSRGQKSLINLGPYTGNLSLEMEQEA